MTLRHLHANEIAQAVALTASTNSTKHEHLAAFDTAYDVVGTAEGGPMHCYLTPEMDATLDAGIPLLLHHTHITERGLSYHDWKTLIDKPACQELWLHTPKGSCYRGAVRLRPELTRALPILDELNWALTDTAIGLRQFSARHVLRTPDLDAFFEEVLPRLAINTALERMFIVEHDFRLAAVDDSYFWKFSECYVQLCKDADMRLRQVV